MAQLRGCEFPDDLLYHPDSHLWFAPLEGGRYQVGVTRFGIALSGEILLFTPKPCGVELDAGRGFGLLEAGKTVFPVKTPFAARLVQANADLDPSARAMNRAPYTAWLVELQALQAPAMAGSRRPDHGPDGALRLPRPGRFLGPAVPRGRS